MERVSGRPSHPSLPTTQQAQVIREPAPSNHDYHVLPVIRSRPDILEYCHLEKSARPQLVSPRDARWQILWGAKCGNLLAFELNTALVDLVYGSDPGWES